GTVRAPDVRQNGAGQVPNVASFASPSAGSSHALAETATRGACIDLQASAPHKAAPGPQVTVFPAVRPGGRVSRAAKGADCKSAGYAFVGSSPTSPTTPIFSSAKLRI